MSIDLRTVSCAAICIAAATPLAADPVAEFYRGRTLDMIVPTTPGGDYDLRARMMARYMPRYIPGNPSIVTRNMPAGVGVGAANYVAKVAPRDGTVLHAIIQNMPVLQAIGRKGIEYDIREFHWIGITTNSPNVIAAWHTTGVKSVRDLQERELVVGAPGATTNFNAYAAALKEMAGLKFKVIGGYPGGPEVDIAMEKGEVGGRSNVWSSWKRGKQDWIKQGKVNFLIQVGLKRAADLADVPLMIELVTKDEDRELMHFLSADTAISRAIVTGPGVPSERVAALRVAFNKAIADPELLAEAGRIGMEITPGTGEQAKAVSDSIVNAPAGIIERAKVLYDTAALR